MKTVAAVEHDERLRRWKLVLGSQAGELGGVKHSAEDVVAASALDALYGDGGAGKSTKGGLGASSPIVSRWLRDIRSCFPSDVVKIMQTDAVERVGLKRLLLEPELLENVEPDIHLAALLVELKGVIPAEAKDTARMVVRRVVDDLMRRLAETTRRSIRGAVNRARRTRRPRPADIDWTRTIPASLRSYQPSSRTIIPERLIGHTRANRSMHDVIICLDQSGSMATSAVYSGIFAAVMASIPALSTRLVAFDTAVVDLSEKASDPVDLLFGIQLGGGTDIAPALSYCQTLVTRPTKTVLVLITDLYDGGKPEGTLSRLADLVDSGVTVVCLLALDDTGAPGFNVQLGGQVAALGIPAFACTPDRFPELMATALTRGDIAGWAAKQGINLLRARE